MTFTGILYSINADMFMSVLAQKLKLKGQVLFGSSKIDFRVGATIESV